MIHVSKKGVDYIFEKFKTCFFSEETVKAAKEIEKITQAYNHRILTKNSIETEKFAKSMLNKIEITSEKYVNVNFELEKNHFKNLINIV